MITDALTIVLTGTGLIFFVAGTVGLLRFPDTHSRLHALTKADNLGLGLVIAGLMVQVPSPLDAGKLVLVWALAILAAGTTAQLVARSALKKGQSAPDDEGMQ
ncbi:cation:proton antiporter [Pelagibacterium lentulum]|uniref:Cation:proton antiporter n=1 Tax=Pelagibacterium lentulum TaxID=2029865 RepID=A0A916RMM6_9HYPH|nr:monovalent cation/H(+) antiporter subunit G [Pelagibacterium lentulum]GGA61903.1 cation:proton antiporter [Pelagibacterium lentulum]